MQKKTLKDVDLGGRRVLMRVDFNVPLTKDRDIADDTRIRAALPSINYIISQGASLVLISHLGRPKGKADPALSLKVVAYHLGKLVDHPVKFVDRCIGEDVERRVNDLKPGEILLLENARFYPGETTNDAAFAERLAGYGDVYANDAFGTAHRAHASTEGVTRFFDEKVAGFLMEKELDMLGGLLEEPERPFIAVLGGAKVSGKIGLVENLLDRVDRIVIGGGMAFTFFKAVGLAVGNSLVDEAFLEMCRELMDKSGHGEDKRIFLPVDVVIAKELDVLAPFKTVSTGDMPDDWMGVDIGDKTIDIFSAELERARTIFWNGPMGVFEMPHFSNGTKRIARVISDITDKGAKTIIGGGDSVAALNQLGLAGNVTHVSTGGGASLELLEGKELPGIVALDDR